MKQDGNYIVGVLVFFILFFFIGFRWNCCIVLSANCSSFGDVTAGTTKTLLTSDTSQKQFQCLQYVFWPLVGAKSSFVGPFERKCMCQGVFSFSFSFKVVCTRTVNSEYCGTEHDTYYTCELYSCLPDCTMEMRCRRSVLLVFCILVVPLSASVSCEASFW